MDCIEALKTRYTARVFRSDPVPVDLLHQIFEAANQAPSWANTQPWEVFVISGEGLERLRKAYLDHFDRGIPPRFDIPKPEKWPPELLNRIGQLIDQRMKHLNLPLNEQTRRKLARMNYMFFGAPVVAFLCMDRTLGPWSMFDLGAYALSIMVAARTLGIDSAIAVNFAAYPELIRKEISIPEDLSIVIGIALGYAISTDPNNTFRSPRRSLNEVVHWIGY